VILGALFIGQLDKAVQPKGKGWLEKIFIQVFDIELFENVNLFESCVKMGGVDSSRLVGGLGVLRR
jgi:hypothetical protein